MFPCYIYYGPEGGERLYQINQLVKSLTELHGDGLEIHKYYLSEDRAEKIISDLDNGTLFASHTLAIINNSELLTKKQDLKQFAAFTQTLGEQTTLIFTSDSDRLDKGLYSLADRRAQEQFSELDDDKKVRWVRRYLEKKQMQMQPEALELFISLVSGNTQDMEQELDKMLLLFASMSAESTMTVELIERYIYHSREESVFTLFEAYSKGDFAGALEILNKLRSIKANEETSILIRMSYQIRQLASLSVIQRTRSLQKNDFRNARVFGNSTIEQYRLALKRMDSTKIQRHLILCSEFEMMLRQHKSSLHHHIIQLWLYSLFFASWKLKKEGKLFTVDHQRFG